LTEKIEEFKWQKNEYDKLVAENQQLNCYKRNILMLEQEKRELESKLAVLGSTRRERTPEDDLGPDSDDLRSQVTIGPIDTLLICKLSTICFNLSVRNLLGCLFTDFCLILLLKLGVNAFKPGQSDIE